MEKFNSESVAQQAPTQPKFAPSDILGAFAIIADVLVTIFIVVGMAQDQHSVTVSVLSGVAFFFLFGALVLLTLSGTLTAIVTNGQNQKTIQQRDALPYRYAQDAQKSIQVVDTTNRLRTHYGPPTPARDAQLCACRAIHQRQHED